MRMMVTVLSLFILAGPAAAVTRTYQCTMRGVQERSWIQPIIFFAHDETTDRIVVSDPAILGYNDGQPAEGTLVANNAKRITVKWALEMRSASNQRVTMNYRATYVKGTGVLNVLALPDHFSNSFNAGGTCRLGVLK